MKKLLILSIVALTLTACSAPAPQDEVVSDGDSVQNQLDADTSIQAIQGRNIALCDSLESSAMQDDCKVKVKDYIQLDVAVAAVDLSECKAIKESSTKIKCEAEVQVVLDRQNELETLQNEKAKISGIVEKGDVSKCASLKDSSFANQCRTNIYINQAIEKGDPAICNKIADEVVVAACKDAAQ